MSIFVESSCSSFDVGNGVQYAIGACDYDADTASLTLYSDDQCTLGATTIPVLGRSQCSNITGSSINNEQSIVVNCIASAGSSTVAVVGVLAAALVIGLVGLCGFWVWKDKTGKKNFHGTPVAGDGYSSLPPA
jgi:hypothetical protein